MITMLGFLILIGTVVNNPILIIDRTIRNIKTKGMVSIDAVLESTRARLQADHDFHHHDHIRICRLWYSIPVRARSYTVVWAPS